MLSVLTQFLSNRSQYVLVDGCRSKLVNVVSGVPQGSALGLLLFLLYTSELFSILENKLIGYADDSTLIAVVPSPGVRVTVAESLNRDLVRVNAWCDVWEMKLNANKTKTMIVSRSNTMHPQPPPLTIDRFSGFVLPLLEYCSAVWCSAADTHLKLLDHLVSSACFSVGGVLNCNLFHRRSVAVLCMLYRIRRNPMHSLCGSLPVSYVPVRVTRGTLIAHRYTYAPPCCRTSQYRRTSIPLSVSLWDDLVDSVFDGVGLEGFKSRSNAFLLA